MFSDEFMNDLYEMCRSHAEEVGWTETCKKVAHVLNALFEYFM